MDLISVVIPYYNHRDMLMRSLRSLAAQHYGSIEVILVDDGSDVPLVEDVAEISELFTWRDIQDHTNTQVTFLAKENGGAPSARNMGLDHAQGEYVIFWDADVDADRDFLKKLHNVLLIHPEASYAYSSFSFGDKKMPGQKFDAKALRENNFIHSTSLIRMADAMRWDESLKRFQDWDLWLAMLAEGKKGIFIPKFLFTVVPRETGMSEWLPSFAYKSPWKYLPWWRGKVGAYERGKQVVMEKHGLVGV